MTAPSNPPITDRLPLSLRAFAGPQFRVLPDTDEPKARRKNATLPASSWTLIFDCETTTHPGQALRFGGYQFRNGDQLDEAGLFYDPDGVTAEELGTLTRYADANSLTLRAREAFVDDVFFAQAYQLRATIVGFNLPFDISRLAIKHGTARAPLDAETSTKRGGFTFKLSHQKIYPHVCVRHLSQRAALIWFSATMRQPNGRGHRRRGLTAGIRRGHFIDVKTIAGALFARSFSLASLSAFLKVDNPKLSFDDFDSPVTDDMVRYAVGDVQATWECYREVMARIGRLGLSRTTPEKIYSEASIGKESNDWERQAMIGLRADVQVEYGVAGFDQLLITEQLRLFIADTGQRKASAALGIPLAALKALMAGSSFRGRKAIARTVLARLPAAQAVRANARLTSGIEAQQLSEAIKRGGLRATARKRGVDPSNLRRYLAKIHLRAEKD